LIDVEFDISEIDEDGRKIIRRQNFTIGPGERIQVPSGAFHNVYTISKEPSCFFYIYINETALEVSHLYERFSLNIMKEYNRTFENLYESKKDVLDRENITWLALNLTVHRNSKEFLHMISFNESKSIQENQNELNRIQEKFEKKNLNYMYDLFTSQFRTDIKNTFIAIKSSFFQKHFKHFEKNKHRFKQRFV